MAIQRRDPRGHEQAPAAATLVPTPIEERLIRRRLRATDLDALLSASARVRRRMLADGRQLIASSWHDTPGGVAMELLFSDSRSEGPGKH